MKPRRTKTKPKPRTRNADLGLGNLDNVPYGPQAYVCRSCRRVGSFLGPLPCECHRKSKYGAMSVSVDGKHFPSLKEARRFSKLFFLVGKGIISDLELQPRYRIEMNGQLICNYVGDFRYKFGSALVVEDTKGKWTPLFKLKLKMLEAYYPDLKLVVI